MRFLFAPKLHSTVLSSSGSGIFHFRFLRHSPSPTQLNCLLNAASHAQHAAQIHALIVTNSYLTRFAFLSNNLINLYAKCGLIGRSIALFASIPDESKTFVTWTSVITQLSRFNRADEGLGVFKRMRGWGIRTNEYCFSAVFHACKEVGDGTFGKQVHCLVWKCGFEYEMFVGSALVDMYGECGFMECAEKVFDEMPERNVVSWNSMIVMYVKNGLFDRVIEIFKAMVENVLVVPSQVSVSSVLGACANSGALEFGKLVHGFVLKLGLIMFGYVRNALMDMYGKCVVLEDAVKLFTNAAERDTVTWNVIAMGCVQKKNFEEACNYFWNMRKEGIVPDEASLSTVLHASANLAALHQGALVHNQVVKMGFDSNICVSSSLVTMYSKCGSLVDACNLFNRIKDPNVVSWTAIISAYQQHGYANEVFNLFDEMLKEGIRPGRVTFVSVLSACSHAGKVNKGFSYFDSMSSRHGMEPAHEHYACMVDLLGRAGRFDEAMCFIESMPIKPEASVWGALLGACRKHGNLNLGQKVAEKLFLIEPNNPGNYVILSDMYARIGKEDVADQLRKRMRTSGVHKEIGCSWINVKSKTYVFTADDQSHAMTDDIYQMLRTLNSLDD